MEITDRVLLVNVHTGELIETLGPCTDCGNGEVQGYHPWLQINEEANIIDGDELIRTQVPGRWDFYPALHGMSEEELKSYVPINSITRTLYNVQGIKEYEEQFGAIQAEPLLEDKNLD